MTFSDTKMMELGRKHPTNTHNSHQKIVDPNFSRMSQTSHSLKKPTDERV